MGTISEHDIDALYDQELAAGRTTLDRRSFVRLAGVTSAGLAMMAAAGRLADVDPATITADGAVLAGVDADDEDFFADCEKYYAACSPECQHHNLCAYVKDGKVVKVGIGKNNESLPCVRGFARVDWLNSAERLTSPLVRDGEKGENKWREVSWDEALGLLAEKLSDAIEQDGNQSIIFDGHAGNFHTLAGQVASAFTSRLGGTTTLTGSLCCAAQSGAMVPMWGKRNYDTRNTIAESDYILVWGNNPSVSMGGYWERFQQCMDAGGISNLVKVGSAWENPATIEGLPTVPRVKFGEYVAADEPNPIDVFVSYRESPMTQFPNTGTVKEALKKIPFVCVIDTFMTSTALYADLVLPCAAVFETEDLLLSSRSHLIQLSEKAVEAPGEAKDDVWIFGHLAEKMGFGEDFQLDNKALIEKRLEGTGYTYEQLKEEKAIDAMPDDFVPYPDGSFYTETGKAELYQPSWLEKGHAAVPEYRRAPETVGGDSGLDATYPLAAVQRKLMTSVHSTFANLESIVAVSGGRAHVMMSETDAAARGISDGDECVVYNDRGEHDALALVTDGIMDGVVCLENGWWEQQGGSSSYVTNDAVGALSAEHCCNETLVEVRKP